MNFFKKKQKINPFRIKDRFKLKQLNKFLRDTGRQKIMERIKMIENKDVTNLPDDILTNILKSCSMLILCLLLVLTINDFNNKKL